MKGVLLATSLSDSRLSGVYDLGIFIRMVSVWWMIVDGGFIVNMIYTDRVCL